MQRYYELAIERGIMRGFFHQPNVNTYPVCIVFHGFTGQKTGTKFSYVQIARALEKRNIATLRLDFLGSGESDLDFKDMTFKEELSCASKILEKVLQMPEVNEVYVLGHSMGGAIASELAKQYPTKITRLCLWAPAFNLPEALQYLVGKLSPNEEGLYDHNGFEISQAFVDDLVARNLYEDLNIYQNKLMIIHGTKDVTVPYSISERYISAFSKDMIFIPIKDGTHNFDTVLDIKKVIHTTLEFFGKKDNY
jgi:pimeloyl-ACP methyl ester carboxylesterase